MVIALIQTTPGTPTLPLERKKKCSFWTFPILHCSLTALTHFFCWNCTVVENTMRWGINELWIIKNHDVYFHTKNVLGFKVAFSVQGLSIIAVPVLCGWDLLCGNMKGTKYAWGKDCETQWEKKEPLNYFSYSALWFAIIRNLVVVFKSKVWAAFMDEIIYTSGL